LKASKGGSVSKQAAIKAATGRRASSATLPRAPQFGDDLPPPPSAIFLRKKPSGTYRSINSGAGMSADVRAASCHVATRPASIFGTSTPTESSKSVFGDDLLSSKSLDEVILGFLAEEFDSSIGKK
jgi:hypothetical protein